MAQIFHPSTNTISKVSIFGGLLGVVSLAVFGGAILRSPYVTQQYEVRDQPVPFSHKHHVADDGIDCRYCHTSVEDSSFAGIPATKTCMNCHSMIWADSPMLEPVRASFETDKSLEWVRVHDLPDYVYFNHSIHVNKGIGCSTCHGRVDEMPLTWRTQSLYMRWCLDCHKQPEQFLRPRNEIFDMRWTPPSDQLNRGRAYIRERHIDVKRLTDCYTCHR
ncbi:MAG TPA: cytochrome c3 family protein [Verrucomicrobiae bacterium]|nr:cytochrome c3 family protein [Verrucomicrobiae bacterium]